MADKLDEAREREIIEACLSSGSTQDAVAAQFEVCRSTVVRVLRDAKVSLKSGPARMLDKEREAAIVQMFNDGATEHAVAAHFGVGRTTVQRTLKRCGAVKSADRTKPRVSRARKQHAVAACVDGMTINEAVDKFGMSKATIDRFLREQKISLVIGCPPTCDVDHTMFTTVNRESAYWMGWLFTDGCVSQDDYGAPTVGMNIQAGDKGHVEKFRDFLKSTHAITHCAAKDSVLKNGQVIHGGPSVTFRVRSEQIVSDLNRHGMDWKKTNRDYINPELVSSPDFWRGCVDGDGSIGLLQNRYPTVELAGNMPLLTHFQRFLTDNNFYTLNIGKTASGIFRTNACGGTAYELLDLLYSHGGPALKRKYERAQELLESTAPHHAASVLRAKKRQP